MNRQLFKMITADLPRELLWHDRETIDELYDDPINKELYTIYRQFHPKNLSALRVLNEAWYICERIYYDDNPETEIGSYIDTVKKDMKNSEALAIVMSMVFTIFRVQKDCLIKKHSEQAMGIISSFFSENNCWMAYSRFAASTIAEGKLYDTDFRPHRSRGVSKDTREKYEAQILTLEMKLAEAEGKIERLSKKKNPLGTRSNKERSFTSSEIINYGENCVEWPDCRPLLTMLKDPRMGRATKWELDKIAEVEKDFKKRKYGDYVAGNKTQFEKGAGVTNMKLPEGISTEDLIRLLQSKK